MYKNISTNIDKLLSYMLIYDLDYIVWVGICMSNTLNDKTIVVGYNSSLISFSIVGVNLLSAAVRINSTDFFNYNIFDFSFILLIITLFLTSIDMLKTYRKSSKKEILITILRFFAMLSCIITGFLLLLYILYISKFCEISNQMCVVPSGNLANIFEFIGITKYIKISHYLILYLVSVILQTVASVFKVVVDKRNK